MVLYFKNRVKSLLNPLPFFTIFRVQIAFFYRLGTLFSFAPRQPNQTVLSVNNGFKAIFWAWEKLFTSPVGVPFFAYDTGKFYRCFFSYRAHLSSLTASRTAVTYGGHVPLFVPYKTWNVLSLLRTIFGIRSENCAADAELLLSENLQK